MTEAAVPARPTHELVEHRGLLMAGVMAAQIMQILDTTIANVALRNMMASLDATIDSVSWVLTSYIIASAIAMPLTGWLSDRLGARNLFLISVAAFVAASMLCGASQNLTQMVIFRALQGVAGAFLSPLSQSFVVEINPPEKQARAMSIWGMSIMIGPILGPVIGGWLTDNYDWRWCFYVNVPVGLAALAVLWWLLPKSARRKRPLDATGFALLSIGLASLQLMLDRGQQLDWFDSTEIIVECGVAIAAIWMFVVHLSFARAPLFSRRVMTDPNFVSGMILLVVVALMMFSVMALLPPMLQVLYGYSVLEAGMLLIPRGIGILLTMALVSRLIGKVDARLMVGIGFTIAAASLWMMTGWSPQMDARPFIIAGFIQGLGMGFVFIPINILAFSNLPAQFRTEGAAVLNLIRSIGASVGISVVTVNLARSVQISHGDLAAQVTGTRVPLFDPNAIGQFGQLGEGVYAMLDAQIGRQALMIAYLNDFKLMMLAPLVALPLLFLLKPARPTGDVGADAMGH